MHPPIAFSSPFARRRRPILPAALGLAIAFGGLGVAQTPAQAQGGGRDPQIDAILKQLEELKAQVEALGKAGPAGSGSGSAAEGALPAGWVKQLQWRSIGPAGMGGRITAISVYEADPSTYWVATAGGGLLKTVNNGVTFEHQFDRQSTVSIGDVCVAPSNKEVVWVGTGEGNPRNSVSYGDGVYKSTDGGKTWTNMGLKGSFQIGEVVVHPKDPDTVYVGALGRLYGPNPERGLFKTLDGGKTWEKVLYVDDKTGVIDVAMHPAEPDTLIVSMWERKRDGFDSHPGEPPLEDGYDSYDPIEKRGPGGGLHKTTDGGKTWTKLTKGLPTSHLGRIDVDYYRKDPNVLFAILDCEKIGMGTPPSKLYLGVQGEDAKGGGARLTAITDDSPAAKAGLKRDDIIKSADGKPIAAYADLANLTQDRKEGDEVTLEATREGKAETFKLKLAERPYGLSEGGRTPSLAQLLGALTEDEEDGLRVRFVLDDRNAARAGIEEDDLIVEVGGETFAEADKLAERLRKAKEGDVLDVKVRRGDEAVALKMTLLPLGVENPNRPWGWLYGGQLPNIQDRQGPDAHEYGGVYRSADGGETWTRVNSLNPRPMYFSEIRVDPSDEKYVYVLGVSLHRSKDGGKTFDDEGGREVHPDHHELWIDPEDGRHMIVGTDGGFYATYDRMEHWEHLNHLAIGQFYHVAPDTKRPYNVYGGLQDNATWGGPSRSLDGGGTLNADWVFISGGDGFVCRVDPFDPDLVYFESQNGGIGRRNLRTGERGSVRPVRKKGQKTYFNWNTPYILSHHNPGILYAAGNLVFRSVSKGDRLEAISPPIGRTGRGTGTALAESPRNPDVLWVGTDDGNLWISRDGGQEWKEISKAVGLPGPRWVATIEPSRFEEGRCYVAFDAHRSDDDEPYLYVTEDYGQTWTSIRANLPTGSTRCLREDLKNPDLLLAGTEFAAYASVDRGKSWTKINNNLPTVAVHELAIHPEAGEVVAATHGRSLWVLDITALRQMTPEAIRADAALFDPAPAIRWRPEPSRGNVYGEGSKKFRGEDPPPGTRIVYALGKKAEKVGLKILDVAGEVVRELPAKGEPGLHVVPWDLLTGPSGREGRGGGRGRRSSAPAGAYRVVLTVDGKEYAKTLRIESDPTLPPGTLADDAAAAEAELPAEFDEEARERKAGRRRMDD